jgi:hypothetical protein
MFCPCISSKSPYAICGHFQEGLMVPSLFERENYCFALYELCPIFRQDRVSDELVGLQNDLRDLIVV